MSYPHHRRGLTSGLLALLALTLLTALGISTGAATSTAATRDQQQAVQRAEATESAQPTIVLVHGGWADSSGWNDEIAARRRAGPGRAPPTGAADWRRCDAHTEPALEERWRHATAGRRRR